MKLQGTGFRIRILAASILFVLMVGAVVLVASRRTGGTAVPVKDPDIEAAIGKLFIRYHVSEQAISTRRIAVAGGEGTFRRIEQRVTVPPEFNSFGFNHDLATAVAPYGAAVVATEKSEDKSVTMHIKRDGVIVQSIVFVVKKENQ